MTHICCIWAQEGEFERKETRMQEAHNSRSLEQSDQIQ